MTLLLERLFKWLFLLSLSLLILAWWKKDTFPAPDFYDAAVMKEPRQVKTRKAAFDSEAGGQRYRITPLYDYRLDGVVVSYHHSDDFSDIYHHQDWQDYLNIKDLCVVWGENVRNGVYRDLSFENSTWTCWVRWDDAETGRRFSMTQLSNNHLLADDPLVHEAIMGAEPGDQVMFRGQLASYTNPGNGFERGTSTVRTDTGNGACETVFVDDFQVVRKANAGWRRLYGAAWVMAGISLVGFVVMLFIAPVRMR